ncbi:TPA: thermonuclease family protein [Klebsiella pneumoniae]|nr:thermonuclease family protein [Klebsiella pneumoniae]
MKSAAAALMLFASMHPALCLADFSGRIVRVIDGDTVQVLTGGEMVRVRLNGIDAPESSQPFGQKAKQNLINLAAQKDSRIESQDKDRYGRWLGTVVINGVNINAEQVKVGMAWAYRYHGRASDENMLRLEQEARQHRIGLWSASNPVEPWKWRNQHK